MKKHKKEGSAVPDFCRNGAEALRRISWHRLRRAVWVIFRTVVLIGISFMILYPMLVKLSASFKSVEDMYDPTVIFLPKHPTVQNFRLVIAGVNYPLSLLRTTGITALISLLQMLPCTLAAYGLARFRFPGRRLVFTMVIMTLVVPPQTILLPLYLRFRFFNPLQFFTFGGELTGLSLTGTLWPFALLSVTAMAFKNGLYIYLLRQHFINMPKVLEEAAYIDGCGRFGTFWRIMLKGALPMILTCFLFAFVWQWNDYYYTSVLAPDLPVLANQMMKLDFASMGSVIGSLYSSTLNAPKFLLHIAPLLLLYVFTQRFFTESIEKSGIVG